MPRQVYSAGAFCLVSRRRTYALLLICFFGHYLWPFVFRALPVPDNVAPLAGAWIETFKGISLRCLSCRPPHYVMGLFCGLRHEELIRLQWGDVIPGRIHVRAEVAKKRRERYCDIPDVLALWLAYYRTAFAGTLKLPSAPIGWSRAHHRALLAENGLTWPRNVLRHSFGSYHLTQNENAPLTAMLMGQTNPDVLYKHYRALVTREDAAEYWSLTPAKVLGIEVAETKRA